MTVDQREKLDTVTRDRPAGDPGRRHRNPGEVRLQRAAVRPGLPDLTAGSVARWNQKVSPPNGYRSVRPRPSRYQRRPASDDWQYADLQYTDASGYTVNTAKYGAGDWQYTATDYNEQGNTVRELDERALRADRSTDTRCRRGAIGRPTRHPDRLQRRHQERRRRHRLTPAGTLVTDAYGPARYAALKDGSSAVGHERTPTRRSTQGAPNAGINPDTTLPYRLPTTADACGPRPRQRPDCETTSQIAHRLRSTGHRRY